jgi:hypothetical protein
MLAAAVPLAPQVAAAVPVVFTVKAEAATVFAVALGAAPFAATIVTVMESPALTRVPPPTVLPAVMLVAVNAAGLTEVTPKFELNGHELQLSPAGAVPFSDTDIVPLARGVEFGVTVQLTVCSTPAVTVLGPKSEDLLHPAGTVRMTVTFVQLPTAGSGELQLNIEWLRDIHRAVDCSSRLK